MKLEIAYAVQQQPLQTTWASGLLSMGGGFFLIPITATFVFGALWGLSTDLLRLLVVVTGVGVVQLAAGLGAWGGMSWPRWIALGLAAAELVGLLLGYSFLALGLLIAGTATILLWRPAARQWSATVIEARR